jgi:hypothetical protein
MLLGIGGLIFLHRHFPYGMKIIFILSFNSVMFIARDY